MSIGENIRYYRKKAGLSANDIAKSIGLKSAQAILQYERGLREPNTLTSRAIASALNITEQDLFAEIPLTSGEKISKARDEKGFSQELLAKKVGISRQYLSMLELGKANNPSMLMINKINHELGIEKSWNVCETTNEEKSLADMSTFDLHILITNASAELAKRATEKAPTDASQ